MLKITLSLALLTAAGPSSRPAEPPALPSMRAGVARGLGYLEKEGVAWLDKNKCVACHHGAWMVWGFREARRAGVAVEERKFDALANRVATMYLSERADHEKKKNGWVVSTYMLLSHYGDPTADARGKEWRKVAASLIVAGQRRDGTWTYEGQGLDLPAVEANEMTTLWAILALPKGGKAEATSRQRALTWIAKSKPGAGHDAAALRLALEYRFGDRARASTRMKELLARQNADGGWSWSKKRPGSDAFATGESLYALRLAGLDSTAPAIRKAQKYLLTTQQPDGSWPSASRKPKGGRQVATYWASAWAVIGLSRSLPPTAK